MNRERMENDEREEYICNVKNSLFKKTAAILGITPEDVRLWCLGGEESALLIVTPEDLAKQIKESKGEA
jgi:hypothetical protein